MTSKDYSNDIQFQMRLYELQDEYAKLMQRWHKDQLDSENLRLAAVERRTELRQELAKVIGDIKYIQIGLVKYYSEEEVLYLDDPRYARQFLKKAQRGITAALPEIRKLEECINKRAWLLKEIAISNRNIHRGLPSKTHYSLLLKDKQGEIKAHLDKHDGTVITEDGKTYVVEFKMKKRKGFINIEQHKREVKVGLVPKKPDTGELDKLLNLINNNEPLKYIQSIADKIDEEKEEREEQEAKKEKSDKAFEALLEERNNIPPTKFKLPKYEFVDAKAPRINNAIGRLAEESLLEEEFEFEWIPKKKNKRHAQEMLALRYGIAHHRDRIYGTVKQQTAGNKVDIYLTDHDICVTCTLEQSEHRGKWGISTFLRERNDWSVCENTTKDVPSGLSQRVRVNYTLNELVEFHKLIKDNYDNQIGLTKKRANG